PCWPIADMDQRGQVPTGWEVDGQMLLERACRLGLPTQPSTAASCWKAGVKAAVSGKPRAEEEVQRMFARACVGGVAQACVGLGEPGGAWMERAAGLYRRMCSQDNVEGCVAVELLYRSGKAKRPVGGAPSDLELVVPDLKRSCRRRKESACIQLGQLYRDGIGVKASSTASRRYFQRVTRIRRQKCRRTGSCVGLLELCWWGVEDACPSARSLSER
ncbi:MAG: hypothetical protein AAFX99_07995, partial [Myxococcota bacterium]